MTGVQIIISTNFFPDINGNLVPLFRTQPGTDWFFYVVLVALVMLAAARTISPRRFLMILNSTTSLRKTEKLRVEGSVFFHSTSIAMFISAVLVATLYVLMWNDLLTGDSKSVLIPFQRDPVFTFGKIAIAISTFWLMKDMMFVIIGMIFKSHISSFLNMMNKYVLNVTTAILLLIFVIMYFYLKQSIFIYIPTYLLLIVYIYRLVRSYMIGRSVEGFSSVYIILYLCTLELLPVLFIYKAIERYMEQSI